MPILHPNNIPRSSATTATPAPKGMSRRSNADTSDGFIVNDSLREMNKHNLIHHPPPSTPLLLETASTNRQIHGPDDLRRLRRRHFGTAIAFHVRVWYSFAN